MMKIEAHHLWLALAFAVALGAAYLSQGTLPGAPAGASPTAGLAAYVADTGALLIVLLVVGGLSAFAVWWRDRGGEDYHELPGKPYPEHPAALSDAWERAMHAVSIAVLGGMRLGPERATREVVEAVQRLKQRAASAGALARDRAQLEAQLESAFAEQDAQDERHQREIAALQAQLEAAHAGTPEWSVVVQTLLQSDATSINGLEEVLRGEGYSAPKSVRPALARVAELKRMSGTTPSPTTRVCPPLVQVSEGGHGAGHGHASGHGHGHASGHGEQEGTDGA